MAAQPLVLDDDAVVATPVVQPSGLYLPTHFAGAGRIPTLTTEAVTLSSGADRRILGVYATLQSALPLAVHLAAIVAPRLLFRNRRELA